MVINMSELKQKIEEIIKGHISPSNKYIIGFSHLEGLVPKKFKGLDYGITIGLKLDDSIIEGIKGGPTSEYAEHYDEVNNTLNTIARDVRKMLRRKKNKAEFIMATLETEDEKKYPNYKKTLSVDFPHKTAATRSGLGWIGKTALFVSWEFGPRIRLVTVLTNKKLSVGQPVVDSLCGKCDICVKKCPAHAANGKNWSSGMRREDFFDAFKCRSTAKEMTKGRIGIDDAICGICIAVCPIGIKDQ